jgi:alpha-glucosidase
LLSDGKLAPLDKARGLAQARAAIMLIMALPGACYMYNGEELGLFEVEDLPHSVVQDPLFERNNRVEKGRDGCRVPLPWTKSGSSFGFGTNGAHLPQPAWFGEFSVETQDGVKGSTLEMYRSAGVLRREHQSTEEYAWVETNDPEVLHFKRDNGWHSITNFAGEPFTLPSGELLLTSGPLIDGKLGPNSTAWSMA